MEIQAQNISFRYGSAPALRDLSFQMPQGAFWAILGANGSGKSTLTKHLNGILERQQGALSVCRMDPSDPRTIHTLRRLCGMVFQNPDNQFVTAPVAEDIAFGLRNFEVPEAEIPQRVEEALRLVGMEKAEHRLPHTLSGGQKQRVALAGVLAPDPQLLVFDEATSMLDPAGRQEFLRCLMALRQKGKSLLTVTHYVEEAVEADQILLLKEGALLKQGTPREILTDLPLLAEAGLEPPPAVQLYYALKEGGLQLPRCPLTERELVEGVCSLK